MEPLSRRRFVQLLGGAAGALGLPLNFRCSPDARIVNSPYVPTPDAPLTPNELFYINYNFGLPSLPPPQQWRLFLRGLVDRPAALALTDLSRFEQVTREVTLECIGNVPGGGLISSAAFTGVRLRDVLAHAGLSERAHGLSFLGLDGYPVFLPADVGRDETALLVHAMNGVALDAVHGAPVRALFPGRHGMFSAKWLDSITATRSYHAYGALRGIGSFIDGVKKVRSRIDVPGDGRTVRLGDTVTLTGLALTPGTGVARVELDVDGAWQPAELTFNTLEDSRSPYLWSLWRFPWTPRRAGRHTLRVRAFDTRGTTQSLAGDFPYDNGALHSLRVLVLA